MTQIGHAKTLQVIPAKELSTTSPRSRLRLNSVRECRRELVKVYTQARSGKLDTQSATRLAFLLQTLVSMIRESNFEERIELLETEVKSLK